MTHDIGTCNTSGNWNDRIRFNPAACLNPDPALIAGCGIEFDDNEDKRVTFRYAEDEGVEDARYFGTISVPEGGEDVDYRHVWGNVDIITRCWDRFQLTSSGDRLAPYEVGPMIGAMNVATGQMDVLVEHSPVVVFDGNVAANPDAFWGYEKGSDDSSKVYVEVIYENDDTNGSDGPAGGDELSFILTNQDGSVDARANWRIAREWPFLLMSIPALSLSSETFCVVCMLNDSKPIERDAA